MKKFEKKHLNLKFNKRSLKITYYVICYMTGHDKL
jgi:hypothetical protein